METKEKLSPGDDVFVWGVDDTIFYGKNGTVKEVLENGKVIVHFHKEFSYIFGSEYDEGKTTHEFDSEDLEKFNLDEFPKTKIERIFKNLWHHLFRIPYNFSPENLCMHKDCEKNATKRILFNCHGSVSEYDVCEKHTEFDGRCADSFPYKKNYKTKIRNYESKKI